MLSPNAAQVVVDLYLSDMSEEDKIAAITASYARLAAFARAQCGDTVEETEDFGDDPTIALAPFEHY